MTESVWLSGLFLTSTDTRMSLSSSDEYTKFMPVCSTMFRNTTGAASSTALIVMFRAKHIAFVAQIRQAYIAESTIHKGGEIVNLTALFDINPCLHKGVLHHILGDNGIVDKTQRIHAERQV